MRYLFIILALFFQNSLFAKAYDSKTLKTKDYEEMRDILNSYIKSSRVKLTGEEEEDVDSAVAELKKGLKILLMRPDRDSIKSDLILALQNEIIKYRSFMAVFQETVQSALEEWPAKKKSTAYQASLIYFMENAVSYLQSINNKKSNAILKKISLAKIKPSSKISSYFLLEMGRGKTASPSNLAGQILKKRRKELKAKQKKEALQAAQKPGQKSREPSSKKPDPSPKNKKPLKPTIHIDL